MDKLFEDRTEVASTIESVVEKQKKRKVSINSLLPFMLTWVSSIILNINADKSDCCNKIVCCLDKLSFRRI